MIDRKYIETQVSDIVDQLEKTWDQISDLIAQMYPDDRTYDACIDLDLFEIRYSLIRISDKLWRKNMPEVLDRYFPENQTEEVN